MSNLIERGQSLAKRLEELRHVLTGKAEASGYLRFFDDFLQEWEFALALHAVCDYLLEPEVPRAEDSTLERIRDLHISLELTDDCIDRLNSKAI